MSANRPQARAHHFVPRCYLNRFTTRGKITAIDLSTGARFTTNPKNVAQERDFNRIDSETAAPDFLEGKYAEFESKVAPVLKKLGNGATCSSDEFEYVLNLITLLASRNPRGRGAFEKFQDDVGHQIFQLATATKERWEGQVKQMREAGRLDGIETDVPYERVREMVANRKLKLKATTSQHAYLEIGVFDKLLEVISQRTWRWLRADKNSGGFITSDHPVCLFSNTPTSPLLPPGYGIADTTVYFPMSPLLALTGEFDGPTDDLHADVFTVGSFNARMVNHAHRQIYAADENFTFFDGYKFFDRDDLLKRVKAERARGSS
ncbi:hypothetical protein ABH989_006183 [Bradyrhizobium ottawaense]|uniref:DUF4238 domain-containing protein n=1 Tax=Bradyrhizobium ottawaense TaxID=931866 RepID=UPI003515848B